MFLNKYKNKKSIAKDVYHVEDEKGEQFAVKLITCHQLAR
jgi:hypothetical protein